MFNQFFKFIETTKIDPGKKSDQDIDYCPPGESNKGD